MSAKWDREVRKARARLRRAHLRGEIEWRYAKPAPKEPMGIERGASDRYVAMIRRIKTC